VVRPEVAATRIARANARLSDAERRLSEPVNDFLADIPGRDLALFYLLLAIQEAIDLAAHWVADAGWAVPDDAASTFDTLADHEVIDRDHAAALRRAVGLRNCIAHGYALLDYVRVHTESPEGIPAVRRFLDLVAREAGLR
jgi:uncharacterized protein YutE (UPF0331/DUF86 family)